MKWWPFLALAAGCSHAQVQADFGSSASAAQLRATGGAALVLGVALGIADPYRPEPAAPLDPDRRISEQDCTRPLQAGGGNLRCR